LERTPSGVVLPVAFGQRFRPGHELAGADQRKHAERAGAYQLRRCSVFVEQHLKGNRFVLDECLCIAAPAGADRGDVGSRGEDLFISLTDLTGPFATGQSAEMAEKENNSGAFRPAIAEPLLGTLRIDQVHRTEGGDVK
jgi:hypothetical protein